MQQTKLLCISADIKMSIAIISYYFRKINWFYLLFAKFPQTQRMISVYAIMYGAMPFASFSAMRSER